MNLRISSKKATELKQKQQQQKHFIQNINKKYAFRSIKKNTFQFQFGL